MIGDRLNQWLALAANIGVLVGIVFLALEIRQNSRHVALQLEFSQPTQKIFEINRDLMDPATAAIVAKSIVSPADLSFDEGLVASSFVINSLNEWEDRYLIHEAELAGVIDWRRHIRENIGWTLGSRFAREVYESSKGTFEAEFVEYIDSQMANVSSEATLSWWTDIHSKLDERSSAGK